MLNVKVKIYLGVALALSLSTSACSVFVRSKPIVAAASATATPAATPISTPDRLFFFAADPNNSSTAILLSYDGTTFTKFSLPDGYDLGNVGNFNFGGLGTYQSKVYTTFNHTADSTTSLFVWNGSGFDHITGDYVMPSNISQLGTTLYFFAPNAAQTGCYLYTISGTTAVQNSFSTLACPPATTWTTANFNSLAWFSAKSTSDNNYYLYSYDGTTITRGAQMAGNISQANVTSQYLYLDVTDSGDAYDSMYQFDGSTLTLMAGGSQQDPFGMSTFGDQVLFYEPYTLYTYSNGSVTALTGGAGLDCGGDGCSPPVEFHNKLYFITRLDNNQVVSLYQYDGSTVSIVNGSPQNPDHSLVQIGDALYFTYQVAGTSKMSKFDGTSFSDVDVAGSSTGIFVLLANLGGGAQGFFPLFNNSAVFIKQVGNSANLYLFDGTSISPLANDQYGLFMPYGIIPFAIH